MRFTEKDFEKFEVSSEKLAPWLIGKILCRKLNNGNILRFRILETEVTVIKIAPLTPTNIKREMLQLRKEWRVEQFMYIIKAVTIQEVVSI